MKKQYIILLALVVIIVATMIVYSPRILNKSIQVKTEGIKVDSYTLFSGDFFKGWKGGYGNFVEVRHNSIYTSGYGHLSRYGKGIRSGKRVRQGQVIGYVGMTGLATGPHLDL